MCLAMIEHRLQTAPSSAFRVGFLHFEFVIGTLRRALSGLFHVSTNNQRVQFKRIKMKAYLQIN